MKKLVCFVVSFILLFATFSFATAETYERDKFNSWLEDWFTDKESAYSIRTGLVNTQSHSLALCEEYIFAYVEYIRVALEHYNPDYKQVLIVYDVGAETAIFLESGQTFNLDILEILCKFYAGEENEVSSFFVEPYNLSNSAPREIYQYIIPKNECTIIYGWEP